MNPEEIKVGETYNVRVKVVKKTDLFIHTKTCVDTALNGCYLFEYDEAEVFSPINSANVTKNTETASDNLNILKKQAKMIKLITNGFTPSEASHAGASAKVGKYDPRRLFRKGDKVRLVEWQGRPPFDCENYEPETAGQLCIVAEDEDAENAHMLHVWKLENMESEPNDDEREWHAFPLCSIELVTPVEKLAPYFVQELLRGWAVYKDTQNDEDEICIYWNEKHPHAKEAAEAECARLNAEYRKDKE